MRKLSNLCISCIAQMDRLIKKLCEHRISQVMCGNQHCIALSKGEPSDVFVVVVVIMSIIVPYSYQTHIFLCFLYFLRFSSVSLYIDVFMGRVSKGHIIDAYINSEFCSASFSSCQTVSCSHGVRTRTVSWVWGNMSRALRLLSTSRLCVGSHWLRSALEETTASPCLSPEPCSAGAGTALGSWAWVIQKVC